ncbi:MAG: OmpA family protein [Polyangiaceae bacterium]
MKTLFFSSIVALCLGVAACTTTTPQTIPQSPAVGLDKPVNPPSAPNLGHYEARNETDMLYSMWETSPIRDICQGPDPFFSFDSAKPDNLSQPSMQNLVDCMRTGALAGKNIMVIGRTDPRGSEDYNIKLGRDRADRVKKYLVANGIDPTRVITDSAGKHDAHADPKEWQGDRRVEIELASPTETRQASIPPQPSF